MRHVDDAQRKLLQMRELRQHLRVQLKRRAASVPAVVTEARCRISGTAFFLRRGEPRKWIVGFVFAVPVCEFYGPKHRLKITVIVVSTSTGFPASNVGL